MNADLTFNSIAFKKSFDEKDNSQRRSTTRGVNTPDDLTIRSQSYVDSGTKVSGVRRTMRIDRHAIDANGVKYITSFYVVGAIPSIATATDVSTALATFKAAIADADLMAGVLNDEK
jgi:hypothetical protein